MDRLECRRVHPIASVRMSLRIRQVKPAFWSDAKLVHLSNDVRLFYIGTWSISDDAGWFDWEPAQVAIDLHMRESFVLKAMGILVAGDRIRLYDCGHGEVRHLVDHQRLAGATKRVETVFRKHMNTCPATFHTSPTFPGTVSKGQERSVKVSEPAAGSDDAVKDTTTKKTTFRERVPEPPSVIAAAKS
jgi:hypothetical protein